MEMLVDSPLAIDEGVEKECRTRDGQYALGSRIAKWLQRYSFLLIHYEIPWGRHSVERQLAGRALFLEDAWQASGIRVEEVVVPLLKIVQKEMDWPNYHFLQSL